MVQNEMKTDQVKQLIDELADLGVNAVTFTGGEPTLRKDLAEIIYHTGVKHDFMNGIATNGYLMPKLLKEHDFEGLDYILTSIDYPDAQKHDKMRGIKVFDRVLEMIKLANSRDIKVIVSTVVMKDNIHLLEDISKLTESMGCSAELFPCEDIIREFPDKICKITNIRHMVPDLNLWAKKIRNLKQKFNHILTDEFSIRTVEKGGFGGFPNYHQKTLRCNSARALLFISHDGYIKLPCKIHPTMSLNAFKYPLSKLFYAKEVIEIMEMHDNFEFCDGCRLGCAIAASIPSNWRAVYAKYVKGFIQGNLI